MKNVLNMLKKHVFSIVCGVVAIGAIVLGVMGLGSMDDVKAELDKISNLHNQFASPSRNPVNDKTIEAEKKRVETTQAAYDAVLEEAKSLNRYEPLPPPPNETFFPVPTRDGRLQFGEIYRESFVQMLDQLKAGEPPSEFDVQRMREEMDEERRYQQSIFDDTSAESELPDEDGLPGVSTKSGLVTSEEAMSSPAARAAMRRAREIHCYANRTAFDEHMNIYDGITPNVEDMWDAQMSLWIQQDIVSTIARINEQAAAELKDNGGRGWVATLPVKELISIRVSDYLSSDPNAQSRSTQQSSVSGDAPAFPPADMESVFTDTKSEDLFDVVQFTLKMVVDARKLPMIIDEISKNRFHALLNIQYVYERDKFENLKMEGRIYGADPTLTVVMDFESIFFGDLYRCMMPDEVLERIKKKCPDRESAAKKATGKPALPKPRSTGRGRR